MGSKSRKWIFAAGCMSVLYAAQSAADPLQWQVGAGVEHSDNVNRVADDTESDQAMLAEIGFIKKSDRSRLVIDLEGDLTYRDYVDDVGSDRLAAEVALVSRYEFSPNFEWTLEDRLSDIDKDSLNPETPDNKERVNLFKTGPRYTYRWSERNQTETSLDFVDVNYNDDSGEDSQRLRAGISQGHFFNRRTLGGLQFTGEHANIDDSADSEVDSLTTALFVRQARKDFDWDASLGYTSLDLEGNQVDETVDGPTGSVSLDYRFTGKTSLKVAYNRLISDASSDEILDNFGDVENTAGVDTITKDRFQVVGEFSPDAINRYRLRVLLINDDYERLDLDEDNQQVDLEYLRRHSARYNSVLQAKYRLRDRESSEFERDSMAFRYTFNYAMMRNLRLSTFIEWVDGTNGNTGDDYDETRAGIKLLVVSD